MLVRIDKTDKKHKATSLKAINIKTIMHTPQ